MASLNQNYLIFLRHLLPTLARFFGLSIENRNELARWAAAADTKGRRFYA